MANIIIFFPCNTCALGSLKCVILWRAARNEECEGESIPYIHPKNKPGMRIYKLEKGILLTKIAQLIFHGSGSLQLAANENKSGSERNVFL